MTRHRLRASALVLASTAFAMAFAVAPSADAQAAPDTARCKAEGLTTSILGLGLPLLTANNAGTPCTAETVGLNGQLPLGISLGALQAVTTNSPTNGLPEERVRTATTATTDVGVDLLLNGLLDVDSVQSNVTAACVGGQAQLLHSSNVENLRVAGQQLIPGTGTQTVNLGLLGVARVTTNEWAPDLDGTGGTQTALRLQVLSLVGVPTVDLVLGRTSASVAGVDCAVRAPGVVITDSGVNRKVTAEVTAGSNAVASTTIAVRPAGSSGAFTDVPSTFDPSSGVITGTLGSSFGPGSYEVRATAADADGRSGAATGNATVARPTAQSPVVSDRSLTAAVAGAPGVALASCSFSLTPAGVRP